DLHNAALDRELATLLLEQPRAVHQLALVDLAFGLGGVEQRGGRQRVVALASLGRRLRGRFDLGQGKRGRGHAHLRRPGRGERFRAAEPWRGGGRGAVVVTVAFAGGPGHRRLAGGRRRPDFGRRCAFLRMLRDHLATLSLAPALFTPFVERVYPARGAAAGRRDDGAEEAAEGELRRHDDRQEDQRENDDERSGAVEVLRQVVREEFAGVAACAPVLKNHTASVGS